MQNGRGIPIEQMNHLEDLFTERNWHQFDAVAHSLKGSSSQTGACGMCDKVSQVELSARSRDLSAVASALKSLRRTMTLTFTRVWNFEIKIHEN